MHRLFTSKEGIGNMLWIHRIALICVIFIVAAAPLRAQEKTFAERLGWPKGAKVVIFHSDDLGLSYNTNTGSIEAMEKGLVTSSSIMMPTPWVPHVVRYAKANPDRCFGLHLTLTSEWDLYRWGPVAGKPAVPGLVDEEGAMWDNVPLVNKNASADEIEIEIRAQIDRALSMGFKPTHMDSHMGTLFSNLGYFQRYMKVGIEKQIPILVCGPNGVHAQRENGDAIKMLGVMAEAIWKAGLPVLDDIHTASYGWKDKEEKVDNYIKALRELQPGVTEIIMHCIHDSEEFQYISTSGDVRHGDYIAMMDPRVKKVIEEEGIILTNWIELMERRQKAGGIERIGQTE